MELLARLRAHGGAAAASHAQVEVDEAEVDAEFLCPADRPANKKKPAMAVNCRQLMATTGDRGNWG